MVQERPNRAVVIAAGNAQTDDIHTSGTVQADEDHRIDINQQSEGGAEFQLWYESAGRLRVTVLAPDDSVFGPVEPGNNMTIGAPNQIAIFVGSRLDDPNNHDNVIGIWIAEGLSEDNFVIQLRSVDGKPVKYHAWLERDDRRQASFVTPVPTHSLGSISTGHNSIVVGSYDAHKPTFPISSFSSSGPTRDGRNKPEALPRGMRWRGQGALAIPGPARVACERTAAKSLRASSAVSAFRHDQKAFRHDQKEAESIPRRYGCDPYPAWHLSSESVGRHYTHFRELGTNHSPVPERPAVDFVESASTQSME
jgi:hypothetical protein